MRQNTGRFGLAAALNAGRLDRGQLVALCGAEAERWNTLLKAFDFGHADEKVTFGRRLDSLQNPAPTPASTA